MASGILYLTFGFVLVVMQSSIGVESRDVDLAPRFEGRKLYVVMGINSNNPENPISEDNLKRRRRDVTKPELEKEILDTGIESNPSLSEGPAKRHSWGYFRPYPLMHDYYENEYGFGYDQDFPLEWDWESEWRGKPKCDKYGTGCGSGKTCCSGKCWSVFTVNYGNCQVPGYIYNPQKTGGKMLN